MDRDRHYRILLLCGWYYPDSVGGTEAYIHQLGRDLKALSWEVTVAAPSIDEREHRYIHDGLSVYRYPLSTRPDREEIKGAAPPKYLDIFVTWLKENKPDIVHFHSRTRGCSFYHSNAVKQLGIPSVLTIHSADFMCVAGTARLWGIYPCDGKIDVYRCTACWLKNRGIPLWWLAWLFSRIPISIAIKMRNMDNKLGTLLSMRKLFIERQEREKRLFDNVEYIIAVSKWLYGVLKINDIPEQKLYFCPHGLIPIAVKSKPQSYFKNPYVLRIGFIGRLNHVKGLHILVKAIKRLPLNMHIELMIYGRANVDEDRDYFNLIQKFSKGDRRIKFCGELIDKDRQDVFMNLDILAVPSIWLETGPYVALEAFSSGIPIIGSNLGGISEIVTDRVNGLLVEPGSIRAWVNAISWIYEHPQVLGDWASHIPNVRSSRDVTEDMLRIYKDILNLK